MTKYFTVFLTMVMFVCVSATLPDKALSQDVIQKIGQWCPRGYVPDGAYCNPLKGAKEIITKIGQWCPSGFAPDGKYCYRIQSKPAKVIPKTGQWCPSGYKPDGAYCVTIN